VDPGSKSVVMMDFDCSPPHHGQIQAIAGQLTSPDVIFLNGGDHTYTAVSGAAQLTPQSGHKLEDSAGKEMSSPSLPPVPGVQEGGESGHGVRREDGQEQQHEPVPQPVPVPVLQENAEQAIPVHTSTPVQQQQQQFTTDGWSYPYNEYQYQQYQDYINAYYNYPMMVQSSTMIHPTMDNVGESTAIQIINNPADALQSALTTGNRGVILTSPPSQTNAHLNPHLIPVDVVVSARARVSFKAFYL